jgi:hypothetical protein
MGTTLAKVTIFHVFANWRRYVTNCTDPRVESHPRDALSRYQNASVLIVSSDGTDVSLAPVRQALQEHPDGFLMVFGTTPPADR